MTEPSRNAPPQEFDLPITAAPEGIGSYFDEIPEPELLEIGVEGVELDTAAEFRRTLGMFATGVTVITTRKGEQVHGMTANAFMSVSLRPPLLVISVDRRARMHALLHEGARYGISVLAAEQELLSDHFAGRAAAGVPEPQFEVVHDTPLVQGAIAHLVARVVRSYWGGDHSLFLGQVEYARYTKGRPLLFLGGKYEGLTQGPPVFGGELLSRLLQAGEERTFADDDTIVRAGDAGDELFFVLEGGVEVRRDGRLVRLLGVGDLFGEIAVLDGGPRAVIRAALEQEPRAAWDLLGLLARRLRG